MIEQAVAFDKNSDRNRFMKLIGYLLACQDFAQSQEIVWSVKSTGFAVDVQSVLPLNDMLEEVAESVYRPVNVFGKVADSMKIAENIGIHPVAEGRVIPSNLWSLPAEDRAGIVISICTARGKVTPQIEYRVVLPSVNVSKFCGKTLREVGINARIESNKDEHIMVISGTDDLRNLSKLNKQWRVTELVSEDE